jgi:hypothetical protein
VLSIQCSFRERERETERKRDRKRGRERRGEKMMERRGERRRNKNKTTKKCSAGPLWVSVSHLPHGPINSPVTPSSPGLPKALL